MGRLLGRPRGPGPAVAPVAAVATSTGVLVGGTDGLWWYPLTSAPSQVRTGSVFAIATIGDGAVVLGANASGHPWLGTVDATTAGIMLVSLPPSVASLEFTDGGVAVNDAGAVVAISGPSSAVLFADLLADLPRREAIRARALTDGFEAGRKGCRQCRSRPDFVTECSTSAHINRPRLATDSAGGSR